MAVAVSTAPGVRGLVRIPGFAWLLATSLIAHVPVAALDVLFVLRTRELTGSLPLAGAAAALFAGSIGLSMPLLGRVIDRRGQTAVLAGCAVLATSGMTVFALLPHGASAAALLGCALVCGLAVPPLGSCWRALMPDVLTGPEQRHAAFSLQSALLELTYVAGPALIAGLLAARSTAAAVFACAALMAGGVAAFASHPASRGARRGASGVGFGAVRSRGVQVLTAIFALVGTGFGAIQVGVPAATAAAGVPHAAGLLLAAWGAGSLVSGLVATHRPAPADPVRRAQLLLIVLTVVEIPVAFATGAPVALAAALFLAGAGIAPTFACLFGLVERVAPAGTATEAYGWLTTGITAGFAVGAGIAGVLAGVAGVPATLALAAITSAGAALLARSSL